MKHGGADPLYEPYVHPQLGTVDKPMEANPLADDGVAPATTVEVERCGDATLAALGAANAYRVNLHVRHPNMLPNSAATIYVHGRFIVRASPVMSVTCSVIEWDCNITRTAARVPTTKYIGRPAGSLTCVSRVRERVGETQQWRAATIDLCATLTLYLFAPS